MPALVSTIWYVDSPTPADVLTDGRSDRRTATSLLGRLFPGLWSSPVRDLPLAEAAATTAPDHVCVGSYAGVTVVCSPELRSARAASLADRWTDALAADRTYLVVSDPESGRGTLGAWERGRLRRGFSGTPVSIDEDDGVPFVWERPYWAGEHPMRWPVATGPDPRSLPFHPRRLVDRANREWLGFGYARSVDDGAAPSPPPDSITVCEFVLHPAGTRSPVAPAEPAPRTGFAGLVERVRNGSRAMRAGR